MYEAYALLVYPVSPDTAGSRDGRACRVRGTRTGELSVPQDRLPEDTKLVIGEDTEDEEEGAA
ncbi:MAG: hypothetical protein LLP51_04025 [Halorhodospira halophila]|uniref:hypothetical protein n=1 Tax=Halorhodospira TaxID=85108 RepID=UPI00191306E0|nr:MULTISPECIES: hypothetical protein [Halorhodospira]MBK5936722.1 hypothetical protein [Halorhodospira halophila]MBK5944422.1 hypothetical protein [Halorhodospira halophila]MCC3750549.1 hypothetical protein [Halorhodospira halophila]MCG5527457.1 hypothetical protein [Halorhodospira halophila]MCG5532823.1 hypothetical protein [Halorhodospira sp. 9621]